MGTFFDTMRRDKYAYKLAIRTKEKDHVSEFSDSLNDAFMISRTCLCSSRSKFGSKHTATVIDGLCDEKDIADRFANVFLARYSQ